MLDIAHREFFLFGLTFNAQDAFLLFFLLTGVGFGLVYVAAVGGRVWCGFACPQTVFLEAVFRRVERLFEGPRNEAMRRNKGPWDAGKVARKAGKHAVFAILAFVLAHIFLSYFVSMPGLFAMMAKPPSEHLEAFLWVSAITIALYINFSWFREQLCLIICPYGRLQAALGDKDTFLVGYDQARGEPRGKAKNAAGACVDCNRCVVVCPTGIDIREGSQLDCVGCMACIDACDEVMDKLGRSRGLVRYDSQHGLTGEKRHIIRPRIIFYSFLLVAGAVAASIGISRREPYEANVLRATGGSYNLDCPQGKQGRCTVRNAYEVHLVNKTSSDARFELVAPTTGPLRYTLTQREVVLSSLHDVRIPIMVSAPEEQVTCGMKTDIELRVHLTDESAPRTKKLAVPFLGPAM